MRGVGLAVSVAALAIGSLGVLPSADAAQLEFVNCVEPTVCQTVTGHGCLFIWVAGWPPEPRVDPDCIGTTAEQAPEAPSSSPDNATEDPE